MYSIRTGPPGLAVQFGLEAPEKILIEGRGGGGNIGQAGPSFASVSFTRMAARSACESWSPASWYLARRSVAIASSAVWHRTGGNPESSTVQFEPTSSAHLT